MSGHWTPGPWKVYRNGVHPVLECGGRGNDNFAICGECYGPDAWFNQHLIAAAPELLQAGKHLAIKLAEVYRAAGAAPADCQALRDWMAAVAKAQGRAAIAKSGPAP